MIETHMDMKRFNKQEKIDCFSFDLATNRGLRNINQDAALVADKDGRILFIVCDGLGGHVYGERASHTAIANALSALDHAIPTDTGKATLQDAISRGHRSLRKHRDNRDTTLVAVCIHDGMITIASIGDSRAVIKCKNQKTYATSRQGHGHIVAHTLSTYNPAEVEWQEFSTDEVETICLATDGLDEISRDTILNRSKTESAETLCNSAIELGSTDNLTLVVMQCLQS